MVPVKCVRVCVFVCARACVCLQDNLVDDLVGLWNCSPLQRVASLSSIELPLLRQSANPSAAELPMHSVLPVNALLRTWGPITQGLKCFDPRVYSTVSRVKNKGFHFLDRITMMLTTTTTARAVNRAPILCWVLCYVLLFVDPFRRRS